MCPLMEAMNHHEAAGVGLNHCVTNTMIKANTGGSIVFITSI
jgi:hypothetical protein